jgi:hypothetical protein
MLEEPQQQVSLLAPVLLGLNLVIKQQVLVDDEC